MVTVTVRIMVTVRITVTVMVTVTVTVRVTFMVTVRVMVMGMGTVMVRITVRVMVMGTVMVTVRVRIRVSIILTTHNQQNRSTIMFEKASRIKIRFNTNHGVLSAEDLWDLKPEQLNEIYLAYKAQQQEINETESLLQPASIDETLNTQVEILKYITLTKIAERDAAKDAAERRRKKARIMELVHQKQDEALQGKSEEELLKLAEEL